MLKRIAQYAATILAMLLLLAGCTTQPPVSLTAIVFGNSAEVATLAVERAGGRVTHDLHLIKAVGATITDDQLSTLAADDALARVVVAESTPENSKYRPTPDAEITTWLQQSLSRPEVNNALQSHLDSVAPTLTGRGIGIALIDTGLSPWATHLSGSAIDHHSFNALTNTQGDVEDITGHGTHLASLILGFGTHFRGVAPDAKIIAVKAFNQEDSASTLDIIRAVQWVVDNKANHNIRVLNLSISALTDLPYYLDPMNMALTRAWNEGLVVVVSAGNEGPKASSITAPGNNPWLITVGAADYGDDSRWSSVAPFSGRGPTATGHIKPDVIVPGTLLAGVRAAGSRRPAAEPDHRNPEGFWITSGASQASAVASGLIALLLEARPSLSNHDVKCILANSASPLVTYTDEQVSPFAQGRGLLDLAAALASDATDCPERLEGIDPTVPLKGAFSSEE